MAATPDSGSSVIDVGDADFDREVLERSEVVPVVVDFWAPWCGPCRALGPILENLAHQHAGDFVLIRVDVDSAPETAARFGIRSIPAVLAFRDGRIVSEFIGAQPEPVVRRFVDAVLPTEADRRTDDGERLAREGDASGAEASFRQALDLDPRHDRARLGLARLRAESAHDVDEALDLLQAIPPGTPIGDEAERLAAELRTVSAVGADEGALRSRLAAQPDDLGARLDLGRTLAAHDRHEEALVELLEVVKRDASFDDEHARRAMLDIFAVLGPDHPLTERFRSELARALYR